MPLLQHNFLNIQLLDGWDDASDIVALGPEEEGFRPNLVFSHEPTKPGETAEEFAARQLPQLRAALKGYAVRNEGRRRFGPNVGFVREQEFRMEKGDIGQLQFYVVLAGRCYTFTVTHLLKHIDRAREIAEQTISRARLSVGSLAQVDEAEEIE